MNKPQIDIKKGEQISSTSKGLITGPTWDASAGKRREDQIRDARAEAFKEHQAKQAMNTPLEIRLLMMEGAIKDLQAKVEELQRG